MDQEAMYRPSFFEMVAQERLIEGLKPALKHIISVLARQYPTFRPLVKYNEELFSTMLYFLERHYLQEYDGSFSENFYGLKRVHLLSPKLSSPSSSSSSSPSTSTTRSNDRDRSKPSTKTSTPSPAKSKTRANNGNSGNNSHNSRNSVNDNHSHSNSSNNNNNNNKDTNSKSKKTSERLRSVDRRRALFFLIVIPYLKNKLDALYKSYTSPIGEDGFENVDASFFEQANQRSQLRRLFVKYYPLFNAGYEGVMFLYQLRFLFHSSPFYSPFLQLAGQKVQRLSMEDMKRHREQSSNRGKQGRRRQRPRQRSLSSAASAATAVSIPAGVGAAATAAAAATSPLSSSARVQSALHQAWNAGKTSGEGLRATGPALSSAAAAAGSLSASASASASQSPPRRLLRRLWRFLRRLGAYCADKAKWLILIAIFVYKFAEWWYSPANQLLQNRSVLPIPPAPPAYRPHPQGAALLQDRTLCPLCRRTRTNAASTNTGYLFCYPCLYTYVQENLCCPVTLIACELDQVRRIYDE